MKGTIAVQIPKNLEEPPEAHGTVKDVCDVLKIEIGDLKGIFERAETIAESAHGRVDKTLESYLRDIKDPRELILLSYTLGKAVTSSTYDGEMPEIVKQAMQAGAQIAMQHISAAVQQPGPGPAGNTEPDVMIQSPGEDLRMYG
jgi:hypothetical protein